MDDMIYRNDSIAEENIDPNGRPAKTSLKNGVKMCPNGQVSATKIKR